MDFSDRLNQFVSLIEPTRQRCLTEEGTKHSLVMPFINILGYDVFNPLEVVPELVADIGIKKGEKIDYAIMKDGKPAILIECKHHDQKLDVHHSQLFRYFSVTTAKFAILTNGVFYQFFTDLDESNKMDLVPFLEIDLLNIRPNQIEELKKFTKDSFDPEDIFSSAAMLKYATRYKNLLYQEFQNPSDDFVRYFSKKIEPHKMLTAAVVAQFTDIIRKGSSQFMADIVNEKLKYALQSNDQQEENELKEQEVVESKVDPITTQVELEAFYIIKSIVRDMVDSSRITFKDTMNYFSIVIDGKVTKWFCRLYLNGSQKMIAIANDDKSENRVKISNIDSIFDYRDFIRKALQNQL